MSKLRPTPESAEVAAIRQQYDREVYALRVEVGELRERLTRGRPAGLYVLLALLGAAIGAVATWLVMQ